MVASTPPSPAPGVGLLTSLPRDTWAKHYSALARNKGNSRSLREIETSLFTLSLDPKVSEVEAPDESSR